MKKILLFLIGSALSLPAMSQIGKGTKFLGASVGNLSYSHNDFDTSLSIQLSPKVGLFVTDKLLLGSTLPLRYTKQSINELRPSYSSRILGYGITPFARYYILGSDTHKLFGELNAGIIWTTTRIKAENILPEIQRNKDRNTVISAALGYNYFLTPGAALEVIAGYGRYANRSSKSIGQLDIQAGFSVFLPSK